MMKTQNKTAEIEFYNKYSSNLEMDLGEDTYRDMMSMLEISGLKPSRVLEVGCGKGGFGRRIAAMGHSVMGIDLNPKIVEESKKNQINNYSVMTGDAEDSGLFKDNVFDIIFCGCILHHLPSIERAVANCSLWLKKNGVLFIVEPNGSNPFVFFSNKIGKFIGRFGDFEKNIGTENEVPLRYGYVSKILRRNGLKIVFNKPYIFFFNNETLDREISSGRLKVMVTIKNLLFKIGWIFLPRNYKGITMLVKAVKV